MKQKIIIRNAVQCKYCGDIIESNYTHDFQTCKCGKISVDGGHQYLRRSSPDPPNDYIEQSEIEWRDIPVCQECMYYHEDQDIHYIGECGLMRASQYGEARVCLYFREKNDGENQD